MSHFETVLSAEPFFHGKVFTAEKRKIKLEDGSLADREIILHGGGVAIVALDEEDRLLMVRQYRSGVGQELLELPAGKLEPGEDPETCGRRELEEECGLTTDRMTPFTVLYPTPAYCSEKIHIFKAGRLLPGRAHLDEGEFLSVERVPFREALSLALEGKIEDAKTLVGVLREAALRSKGALLTPEET